MGYKSCSKLQSLELLYLVLLIYINVNLMISKIFRKDISLLKHMNMSTKDINNWTGNKNKYIISVQTQKLKKISYRL